MEENQKELQTTSIDQSTVKEETIKTEQAPSTEPVSQLVEDVKTENDKTTSVPENQKSLGETTPTQPITSELPESSQPTQVESPVAPMAPIPPFVARTSSESAAQTPQNGMNLSQNPTGDGVRRLRKIKRPVKRLPQGNPLPPSSQMINLDELLDSQMNLPTTMNAPTSNNSNQQETVSRQIQPHPAEKPRFQPRFISENDLEREPRFIDQLMIDNLFTYKGAAVIAGVVFVLTLIIGMMIFGGETVVKDGLQGVIVNAEVPRGRARCGVAERTQGCVLYIMNPQRQDLQGRDFYDLASQLTGRQRFVIETGNMRYSNVKIRAGEIAQINIPPLQ
ncbi:MAG: hypothetical protein IJ660_04435 [Alphaproteobacteria bacterium]|nr:hypothetical protein [Alphaproteobacteria bacterium]